MKASPTLQTSFKPLLSSYALWHRIGPNESPNQSQCQGNGKYTFPQRGQASMWILILCQGNKELWQIINHRDPVRRIFIFVVLLLYINHMLLVMKSLQSNPPETSENTEDAILSASLNNRNPFLLPSLNSNARSYPKEVWNLSNVCHWQCLLLCKYLRVLLLKWLKKNAFT